MENPNLEDGLSESVTNIIHKNLSEESEDKNRESGILWGKNKGL